MKAFWAVTSAFLLLIHKSAANLDIITLPANGNTWIQEAEATLILGDVPEEITGDAALWSAIMMDQQDFLQGVTQNSPESTWCQNLGRNWCNFAYTLKGSSVTNGTPVRASAGDRIRTHYRLNSSTNLWDQNLLGEHLCDFESSRPVFKHSGAWEYDAAGGAMSTADNGMTWKLTKLNVPAIVAA
ncbi:hypothetical protein E8E12_000971 [Didymella heteroderae]|uniref:Uncharacterized protein n=1 Tax=Didymella heteroderae TaxID=1769908 RepID=A0A9P4WXC2_9PLEO|nr:hypothetical protein E8E12_000971 [Didymella heteroderae]